MRKKTPERKRKEKELLYYLEKPILPSIRSRRLLLRRRQKWYADKWRKFSL